MDNNNNCCDFCFGSVKIGRESLQVAVLARNQQSALKTGF
jgi:hypothetical protein